MLKIFNRAEARRRRHKRVRDKVTGTAERPRLTIYRSLHHTYAQVIDDVNGRTLASASTVDLKSPGNHVGAATAVGKAIAERAAKAGIRSVVFDRGGYLYHGRVQALADAARESGLEF